MTTVGVFAAVFDETGRVLCVRQNYGERCWAMPGGRMKAGEDPETALRREVLEESGVVAEPRTLVGLYSAIYRDDLVILFTADVRERRPWSPDEEIVAAEFFPPDALPEPMSANTRLRFADVVAGRSGLVRTLVAPGKVRNGPAR